MYRLTANGYEHCPENGTAPNGEFVCGLANFLKRLPIDERQAAGWYSGLVVGPEGTPVSADSGNDCIWVPPPPAPVDPKTRRFEISKNKLFDKFDELGVSATVSAYIEADAKRKRRFDMAPVLFSDDPLIMEAVVALGPVLQMTESQMRDLLRDCRPEGV